MGNFGESKKNELNMVPIGAIISAAAGVGSSVYGAIESAKRRKEQREIQKQADARQSRLYNRDYYLDLNSRADMQYALRNLREQNRENQERARRTQAVTGGTTDSEATTRMAGARAAESSMARIGALNTQQKNMATSRFANAMAQSDAMRIGHAGESARQAANLMANGAQTAINAAGQVANDVMSPAKEATTGAETPGDSPSVSGSPREQALIDLEDYGKGKGNL